MDAYQQLYPDHPLQDVYFFFDEIQNIPKWEIFVRRLEETLSKKIFITGSSSKLLAAMEAFDLKEGFIVTHSQSETLEVKGFKINVVTAWQWILGLLSFHRILYRKLTLD